MGLDYEPYKINKGWFQPKSVKSYILGSYGQKMTVNQLAAALQSIPGNLLTSEKTALAPGERTNPKSTKRSGPKTGNRTNSSTVSDELLTSPAAKAAVRSIMELMKWILGGFR